MVTLIVLMLLGLCWGSFLNVVGHRLLAGKSLFTMRSQCPWCEKVIAWYDLFPLISWVVLKGRCRSCKTPISFLYPFIEFVSSVVFTCLFYHFFPFGLQAVPTTILFDRLGSLGVFALFLSALIVALRTDLQGMVVFQITTLWMVPIGLLASCFHFTKISCTESLFGMIMGYGFLWIVSFLFKRIMKKEGIGVGDLELVAMIGSFLGPVGVWMSVLLGSLAGLLFGAPYLYSMGKTRMERIPFAPFLAFGAVIFFFFEPEILKFLLYDHSLLLR